MKKFLLIALSFVLSFTSTTTASAQPKAKFAVYVSGDVESEVEDIIAEEFIHWLSQINRFEVLTRSEGNLNAIMREQDYQLSGAVDDKQIKLIGKQHGAKYVVNVNVVKLGNLVKMTATTINIETSRTLCSKKAQRKIKSAEEFLGLAGNVARQIYQTLK